MKDRQIINRKVLTLLLIFPFLFILSSLPSVNAQQTGCCEKTTTAYANPVQYCVDDVEAKDCDGNFNSFKSCSDVSACQVGTLICRDGCISNKTKSEAVGSFREECTWSPERNLEDIDECKVGCCSIPSWLVCNTKQSIVCTEEADDRTFNFEEGITTDSICSNYCGQQEFGTCITESGCSYDVKKDCIDALLEEDKTLQENVNFYPDTPVCEVLECGAICKEEQACGKPSYGNDEKICWYDNKGNIGACPEDNSEDDCGGITYTCSECESDECQDTKRNKVVNKGEPYCKYTNCDITLTYGGQKWEEGLGQIANLPNNRQESVLNTRSICYNFYTKFVDSTLNDDSSGYIDSDVLVSTGLQNSKIVCQNGISVQEAFGEERVQLCEQTGADEGLLCRCTSQQINKGSRCRECGTGAKGLGVIFGDIMGADRCDKAECNNLGDCVFHTDYSGIGSCDPKFPYGTSTTCADCGEGGDSLYNMPTKQECYSLGNCNYADSGPRFIQNIFPVFIGTFYGERLSWTPVEGAIGLSIATGCLVSLAIPGGAATAAMQQSAEVMCGLGGCTKCLTYGPTQFLRYGITIPIGLALGTVKGIPTAVSAAKGLIFKK